MSSLLRGGACVRRLCRSLPAARPPLCHTSQLHGAGSRARGPRRIFSKRNGSGVVAAAQQAPSANNKNWPGSKGELVSITQSEDANFYYVVVQASGCWVPEGAHVDLHWGVYRSDVTQWQHPEAIVPPGSQLHSPSGGMRSRMEPAWGGAAHAITLSISKDLAPLTLAFVVYVSGGKGTPERYIAPLSGTYFSELVGMGAGVAEPLGASWLHSATAGQPPAADGQPPRPPINFAVRTRGAERVSLLVLKPPSLNPNGGGSGGQWGCLEIALDPWLNRTGDTWHISLSALRNLEGLVYGWRVEGDMSWDTGNRFQPDRLLLDPQAPLLAYLPLDPPPPLPLPTVPLANGGRAGVAGSLAVLLGEAPGQEVKQVLAPEVPLEKLRAMEVDVRSFAIGKKVRHVSQFLGVAERAGDLRAVGINAVLLTPPYATAPGIGPMGRASISYMAPDPELGSNPADPRAAARDFKQMVAALHSQGIEVIMQVDFTFTAEGNDTEPNAISFRGLDHAIYYRQNANGVLNCGQVAMREFILSMARHWAQEYGVDGFCMVNAENLSQDRDGQASDAPPLADALVFDPYLASLKFIAAPSDESLLPRGGARGFPHWGLWLQRNNAFTRDILAFLIEGTSEMASKIATRITGSPDLFAAQWDSGMPGDLAAGRRPAFSVNGVATLGHRPLQALAADAAAMVGAAYSPGFGSSGVDTATVISKTLLLVSVLSMGTPVVTQEIASNVELARFVGVLMRLRRGLQPLLAPPMFDSPRNIGWRGAAAGSEPDWDGSAAAAGLPGASYIGFSVYGPDLSGVYVGINPHNTPVDAALPTPPGGMIWSRVVDTGLEAPDDATLEGGVPIFASTMGNLYTVAAKGAVVMIATPPPAWAPSA